MERLQQLALLMEIRFPSETKDVSCYAYIVYKYLVDMLILSAGERKSIEADVLKHQQHQQHQQQQQQQQQ